MQKAMNNSPPPTYKAYQKNKITEKKGRVLWKKKLLFSLLAKLKGVSDQGGSLVIMGNFGLTEIVLKEVLFVNGGKMNVGRNMELQGGETSNTGNSIILIAVIVLFGIFILKAKNHS